MDNFKSLNLKKEYDVTFVGKQKHNRAEFIKYLKDNGINVHVFGWDWDKLPEFNAVYHGIPDNGEMVKIISKSKINLSFSENKYGKCEGKGRIFEISACNSFGLAQFFEGYLDFFKNSKEIVMFKDKKDLLKKIKYYLAHEKERENVADNAYKKMKEKYDINIQLRNFIEQTYNKKTISPKFPKINKKVITLYSKDMNLDLNELMKKISASDYISFNNGKCRNYPLKNYLQAYSLNHSEKEVTCCSYYVNSKSIGNYLFLLIYELYSLTDEELPEFLNINQLMVTRNFFIKHLNLFKKALYGEKIKFLTRENTIFMDIPLIDISELPTKNYSVLKKIFRFKFPHKLYSLFYNRDFFNLYPIRLFFEAINGKFFIFKILLEVFKDNSRRKTAELLRES